MPAGEPEPPTRTFGADDKRVDAAVRKRRPPSNARSCRYGRLYKRRPTRDRSGTGDTDRPRVPRCIIETVLWPPRPQYAATTSFLHRAPSRCIEFVTNRLNLAT